jgi:hypothetical protein
MFRAFSTQHSRPTTVSGFVDGTQSPYRGRVYMNSTVWTNATGPTRARALALLSFDGGRTLKDRSRRPPTVRRSLS